MYEYGYAPEYVEEDTLRCPVCKIVLGYKKEYEVFSALCEECDANFTWPLGRDLPNASLKKASPVRCGCGCGR